MENGKFANYEMVNDDHLKLIIEGKTNGKDSVFECNFYRLEPTITILKKEEIEKLTFVILENERESEFVFNKELWDQERLERHNRKEGEKN